MDATLVETHKQQALYSYKKYKAYQPLTTYWAEAELIVHSEFRDGNVPAGYQQLRVLTEALEHLPCAVDKVMLRSDAAGYQHELLRYCAEGRDERFGVIEFAVGLNVTPEFRRAVSEVAEQDWHAPHRRLGATWVETGQQWAEVNFVPDWIAYSKKNPEYRFIAIREPLSEQPLPGMELQLELPFPVMRLAGGAWHKVSGLVTNRDLPGDEMIRWYRQRCGKGEQVHSVLKSDLAAGRLPSGLFGANAAWWAIAVLAFNLSSAMKRLVLGGQWVSKRLKAVRFALIALPGRVMRHARKLIIRLARGHPSYELSQIPHPEKRKTSLEPAVKGAKMFLGREKRSPTRCTYYEARGSAVPVRAGEELAGHDGDGGHDDVLGVDARSRFEVVGRAPRGTAGVWSGLDGQPSGQLADTAEPGRR